MDTLHPVWFGRKDGYLGTTHSDAEEFCKTVGLLHLCPIEAYCPNGRNTDVNLLFFERDPFIGEQWAPVSKYDNSDGNEWVLIGMIDDSSSSTCMRYEQLYNEPPQWGMDGSQTELKENILCCINPSYLKNEMVYLKDMNAIWLDESHGWKGGSHSDAINFCHGLAGKKLCPYGAYCPHGPAQPVIGGHIVDFNSEGEQWAPVHDFDNHWVLVGQKYQNSATTCMTHMELEGSSPDWGLTNENAHLKKHIMCCSF